MAKFLNLIVISKKDKHGMNTDMFGVNAMLDLDTIVPE
jgi:hypothetical protein